MSAPAAHIPANLVINADDFGIHPRVSRAIALCVEEGLVNSISALPLADDFHRDLLRQIVARHPGVKVGAHLTVLSGAGGLAEHPDHFLEFLGRFATGRHRLSRIRAEWSRQVESLADLLGGMEHVDHLDGHQHLHMLPGLWSVARGLQERHGIPRLRIPYEGIGRAAFHRFPFGLALQTAARLRSRRDTRRLIGFATSTCFTVEANRTLLEEVLRRPDLEFELMVHPALPGSDGPAAGAPNRSQEAEVAELRKLKDFFQGVRVPASMSRRA